MPVYYNDRLSRFHGNNFLCYQQNTQVYSKLTGTQMDVCDATESAINHYARWPNATTEEESTKTNFLDSGKKINDA